jgi:hypothetical protein
MPTAGAVLTKQPEKKNHADPYPKQEAAGLG